MTGIELLDPGLPAGVAGGFTTRAGGVSDEPWDRLNLALHVGDEPSRVRANRDRLARRLRAREVSFAHQVHGAAVLVVDELRSAPSGAGDGAAGAEAQADALVTALPGVAIGVLVADCLPVLLADPVHGVVGAAHAGRRGLAAGVLQATLAAMAALGAEPAATQAVIGPAICGQCYEVPAALQREVAAAVAGTATRTRAGTPGLDLPAGAAAILHSSGLGGVRDVQLCTAEDARLYSYRRDGVTGRFAGVVMLERR